MGFKSEKKSRTMWFGWISLLDCYEWVVKTYFQKEGTIVGQVMNKTMAESIYKTLCIVLKYLGAFGRILIMFFRLLKRIMLSNWNSSVCIGL